MFSATPPVKRKPRVASASKFSSPERLEPQLVRMEELQVGDTIEVWWSPRRDTITRLSPYTGPLACLKGAKIASFALNRVGMTLEPGAIYVRIA